MLLGYLGFKGMTNGNENVYLNNCFLFLSEKCFLDTTFENVWHINRSVFSTRNCFEIVFFFRGRFKKLQRRLIFTTFANPLSVEFPPAQKYPILSEFWLRNSHYIITYINLTLQSRENSHDKITQVSSCNNVLIFIEMLNLVSINL